MISKDSWSGIGCSAFYYAVVVSIFVLMFRGCEEKKTRPLRNGIYKAMPAITGEIGRIREQHREDSLAAVHNSKEYKDSVARAEEAIDKKTLVLACYDDKTFHYATSCTELGSKPMITTRWQAKKMGCDCCWVCDGAEDIENCIAPEDMAEYLTEHYSEQEIIKLFQIDEYIRDNYSKEEIIDMFDITEEDL